MYAVIFEVTPKPGLANKYLEIADALKKHLETIEGFISIERFQSLSEDSKLLSLSFWRDEIAIKKWRDNELHQVAQLEGRKKLFSSYRIRVAEVDRDYSKTNRRQAPSNSLVSPKISAP